MPEAQGSSRNDGVVVEWVTQIEEERIQTSKVAGCSRSGKCWTCGDLKTESNGRPAAGACFLLDLQTSTLATHRLLELQVPKCTRASHHQAPTTTSNKSHTTNGSLPIGRIDTEEPLPHRRITTPKQSCARSNCKEGTEREYCSPPKGTSLTVTKRTGHRTIVPRSQSEILGSINVDTD